MLLSAVASTIPLSPHRSDSSKPFLVTTIAVCTKLLESNRKFLTISDRRRISASTRNVSVHTNCSAISSKAENLEKIAQKTSANALLTLRLRVAQLSEIYALMKTFALPHAAGSVCFVSGRRKFAQIVSMQPRCERRWRVTQTFVFKTIDSRRDARLVPDRCCPNTIAGSQFGKQIGTWRVTSNSAEGVDRSRRAITINYSLFAVWAEATAENLNCGLIFLKSVLDSTSEAKNLRKFRSGRALNGAQSGMKCS